MRRIAAWWGVVCALGCAATPPRPPVALAALAPAPGERVAVQQVVSVFDASFFKKRKIKPVMIFRRSSAPTSNPLATM